MNLYDWSALAILLGFLLIGTLAPWRRRERVIFLIAVFLGLHLFPWIAGLPYSRWIMPFRAYDLYGVPAPLFHVYDEVVLVTKDGREYPVDLRTWQPFIPRAFNSMLRRWRGARTDQERIGRTLVKRVKEALEHYHEAGQFDGWNGYLLGPFHYPEHQSPALLWGKNVQLPAPAELGGVRIYRVQYQAPQRRQDASRYHRTLLYEFPA